MVDNLYLCDGSESILKHGVKGGSDSRDSGELMSALKRRWKIFS